MHLSSILAALFLAAPVVFAAAPSIDDCPSDALEKCQNTGLIGPGLIKYKELWDAEGRPEKLDEAFCKKLTDSLEGQCSFPDGPSTIG
ncbi:hypothetical protein N7456_000438 [Penicillium angulare]|uniref:Pheromone n=1 Tax=Penicillium angulare TaxID=116970 RepID=A0A9W9KS46_9EURO|nr:hypothetical protein N7456_000438 [Penicillium angulare]